MANTYVNKVQLADGTSLIDISDTTATADKILQGYTAYGADGSKLTGTASGGGSVTQDQDGFIVLPTTGSGGGGSTGLEYESGTWTPSEDIAQPTINFTNSHDSKPLFVLISDVTGTSQSTNNSELYWAYIDYYTAFGQQIIVGSNSYYARQQGAYRATANSASNSGSSEATASTTYVSSTCFKPTNGASYYWRANRTYKWIAVWAPTT